MNTAKRITITPDQYAALLAPLRPPSAEELFEFQRATLAEKKLAPVEMFDGFARRLPESGLFILVPPQPAVVEALDWSELMARVEEGGKTGRNYLDPKYLRDEVEVASVPTMLVGVEDGRGRLNIRLMDSRTNITREGRHPYTAWRGYIHIALFPAVLQHHYLDCVGSRFKVEYVPSFYLDDGKPALSRNWEDNAFPRWGAPSCGSVEA